jgi:hypothetical protein
MLFAKVDTLALNTSIGLQSVTGLGFTPKVIMFNSQPDTANVATSVPTVQFSMGASDGITQLVEGANNTGNVTSAARRYADATHVIKIATAGTLTTDYSASLNSIDVDGFTLNIDDAPPVADRFSYWALGGNDIANVKVGRFQSLGATGVQAVTGIGFKPDVLIFFSADIDGAIPFTGVNAAAWIGIANGTGVNNQYSLGAWYQDAFSGLSGGVTKANNTGRIIQWLTGITFGYRASLTSFDVDGFTLNWATHTPVSLLNVAYIAIKGGVGFAHSVGTKQLTNINTSQTNSVATLTFQPKTGLFICNSQSINSSQFNGAYDIGWADDGIRQFNGSGTAQIQAAAWQMKRATTSVRVHRFIDYSGGPLYEDVSLQSWNANGFTLFNNKGSFPNTGGFVGYLVMQGNTPETAGQIVGQTGMVD